MKHRFRMWAQIRSKGGLLDEWETVSEFYGTVSEFYGTKAQALKWFKPLLKKYRPTQPKMRIVMAVKDA